MRTRNRLLAASLLLLPLSGCKVGPDYHTPPTTAPATWTSVPATQPVVTTAAADLTTWWTVLNDPALNELVTAAASQNLDLRAAAERVNQARALRGVASADQLPTINADGQYQRERLSKNTPLGRQFGNAFNDWQAGFDASWELDFFGRVRRNVEAADADIAAAGEVQRDVMVRLVAETARDYVDLRAAQRRLAVAENTLAAQKSTLELVRARRHAGAVGDLDVTRAQADVHTTEATLPAFRGDIDESIYGLAALLSESPAALHARLTIAAPIPVPPAQVAVGLPSELMRRRPDIRRSERELASATARIGVAVADYYPRFSLTGSFVMDAVKFARVGDADSHQFAVGPSFEWNIFDAGRIRNNVLFTEARQREILAQYQQTIVLAVKEVETALSRFATDTQRRQSLVEAVNANEQSIDLAKQQYEAGTIDLLQVLDTQRNLFASQDALARNDQAIATQLIAIYKSAGGGWSVWGE